MKSMTYVRIDLHKEFLQVETMDNDGNVLFNERIQNTHDDIRNALFILLKDSKCVVESSSIWYVPFRFMRDKPSLDVILSNPHHTKAIVTSKKKTDKIDAHMLADLLRRGYISECYIREEKVVDSRQLVRYRTKMVRNWIKMKNYIPCIIMQKGIKYWKHRFQICISADC